MYCTQVSVASLMQLSKTQIKGFFYFLFSKQQCQSLLHTIVLEYTCKLGNCQKKTKTLFLFTFPKMEITFGARQLQSAADCN